MTIQVMCINHQVLEILPSKGFESSKKIKEVIDKGGAVTTRADLLKSTVEA